MYIITEVLLYAEPYSRRSDQFLFSTMCTDYPYGHSHCLSTSPPLRMYYICSNLQLVHKNLITTARTAIPLCLSSELSLDAVPPPLLPPQNHRMVGSSWMRKCTMMEHLQYCNASALVCSLPMVTSPSRRLVTSTLTCSAAELNYYSNSICLYRYWACHC